MKQLYLNICEAAEIKTMSAHVQDMIIRTKDMAFLKAQKRFVVVGNRFCWERSDQNYRTLCGFHFDHVEKVSYRAIERGDQPRFIHLLAICLNAEHALEGIVRLIFAGEGEIQLEVEAIQAHLHDMGECWQTRARPAHLEGT